MINVMKNHPLITALIVGIAIAFALLIALAPHTAQAALQFKFALPYNTKMETFNGPSIQATSTATTTRFKF